MSKRNVTAAPPPAVRSQHEKGICFCFCYCLNSSRWTGTHMYDTRPWLLCEPSGTRKKNREECNTVRFRICIWLPMLFSSAEKILGTWWEGAIINLRERHRERLFFFSLVHSLCGHQQVSMFHGRFESEISYARAKTFTRMAHVLRREATATIHMRL